MKGKLNKNEIKNKKKSGGVARGVSNGGFRGNVKKTPFADAGSEIGALLGLPKAGKSLGGLIGSIFGSGDYTENFSGIKSNTLLSTGSVPSFGNMESTIIEHRESIQDIISSSVAGAFKIESFAINPGQNATFPWLSDLASNYEEYQIMGMVFEFKAMSGASVASTNTALGSVILATEYDPTKPAFTTKQQMENYFFAQSNRPDQSVMHAIECKGDITPVKQLYVRTGTQTTNTDLRWNDFGNFYIATTGLPGTTVTVGELWVTYKVKFFKPRLPITVGDGGQIASGHVYQTGATSAAPLGLVAGLVSGPLKVTITNGLTVSWLANPQSVYVLYLNVTPVTSCTALASASQVNLVADNLFVNDVTNARYSAAGTGSNSAMYIETWKCSGTNGPVTASVTLAAPTIVGAANADVFVFQIDNTITA
jgi:hypothetical protein